MRTWIIIVLLAVLLLIAALVFVYFKTQIVVLPVGGEEVREGDMPWTVYLSIDDRGQRKFCGGAMVNLDWVVTAAHCIPDPELPENITAYVYMYVVDLENPGGPRVPVKFIKVHDGFAGFDAHGKLISFENDLALLRLDWGATDISDVALDYISEFAIRPLDPPEFDVLAAPGSTAVIAGWGETEVGEASDRLLYAMLKIISNEECRQSRGYDEKVSRGMICGTPTNHSEAICRGDSGGPLIVGDPKTQQARLAGIASWRDEDCRDSNKPSVFMRVETTDHWIARTIAKN